MTQTTTKKVCGTINYDEYDNPQLYPCRVLIDTSKNQHYATWTVQLDGGLTGDIEGYVAVATIWRAKLHRGAGASHTGSYYITTADGRLDVAAAPSIAGCLDLLADAIA